MSYVQNEFGDKVMKKLISGKWIGSSILLFCLYIEEYNYLSIYIIVSTAFYITENKMKSSTNAYYKPHMI